jgi:hypothetical protein
MKCVSAVLVLWLAVCPVWAKEKPEREKTGGTSFWAYEGQQQWPVGQGAQKLTAYRVPIYLGVPNKPYRVLGRIVDDHGDGVEVIGKEVGGFFSGEKRKLRNIANQARLNGAEAVMITDDAEVVRQLGVTERELKKTSPLGKDRRRAVLAIQFQ